MTAKEAGYKAGRDYMRKGLDEGVWVWPENPYALYTLERVQFDIEFSTGCDDEEAAYYA